MATPGAMVAFGGFLSLIGRLLRERRFKREEEEVPA